MPKDRNNGDDDVELCPVALTARARVLLNDLSKVTGKPPLSLAADLLSEMLEDDARTNTDPAPTNFFN